MRDKKETEIVYQFYDSFFCYLFKEKSYCLDLYNALYRRSYTDLDLVKIIDLDKVFYSGKRSDLIFRCDNRYVVMAEHQSSYCGNMPLRMFIYAALESYSYAIYLVREYQKGGLSKHDVVVKAISRCYDEGKLGEFFDLHREEVILMLLEDNYWEESLRLIAEEAKQECRMEGHEQGRVKERLEIV